MSGYQDLAVLNQALSGLGNTLTQQQMLGFNQKQALQNQLMQQKQFEAGNKKFGAEMDYRNKLLGLYGQNMRMHAGNLTPEERANAAAAEQTIQNLAQFKYKGDRQAAVQDAYTHGMFSPTQIQAHKKIYGGFGTYPTTPEQPSGPSFWDGLFGGSDNSSTPNLGGATMPQPIPQTAMEKYVPEQPSGPGLGYDPTGNQSNEIQAATMPTISPTPTAKAKGKQLAPNIDAGRRRMERTMGLTK